MPLVIGCLSILLGAVTILAFDDPVNEPGWTPVQPVIPPGDTRNCAQVMENCTSFTFGNNCYSTSGDATLDHCVIGNEQAGTAGVQLIQKRTLGKCQAPPSGVGTGCGEITNPECAIVRLYGSRVYIGPNPPNEDDLAKPANWQCNAPKCYKVLSIIGSYCIIQ